jgi:hypothetical protein
VLTASLGSEEMDSWRHPVDLVALMERALPGLTEALAVGRTQRGSWREQAALGRAVLGEDPEAIFAALSAALRAGAAPTDVARAVAFAAALRIAHFGTSNDHSDWETEHHTFTYTNAAHGLIARATSDGANVETEALCLRAALHGALAIYFNRYLNIPPARLPPSDEPALSPVELRRSILDACDRQQQVAEAARLTASHLAAGWPPADFIAVLAHAVLREDAGFHMVQNLQAAVRQCLAWHGAPEVTPILIAAARYLAAHSPTSRSGHQTAQVACRLMRGGEVHEDTSEAPI